jgi:hypothetical protein
MTASSTGTRRTRTAISADLEQVEVAAVEADLLSVRHMPPMVLRDVAEQVS